MTNLLLIFWLVTLTVVQAGWAIYYSTHYVWRDTPLGPVWLAKGSMFAVTWMLLLLNEHPDFDVPTWVWAYIVGPPMTAATVAWLVVTVRVRRGRIAP